MQSLDPPDIKMCYEKKDLFRCPFVAPYFVCFYIGPVVLNYYYYFQCHTSTQLYFYLYLMSLVYQWYCSETVQLPFCV